MRTLGAYHSHLALLLVFYIVGAFAPAWAQNYNPIPVLAKDESSGPETGGGGNIVLANGQLVLLDFYNFPDISQVTQLIEKKFFSSSVDYPFSLTRRTQDKERLSNSSPANFINFSEILLSRWGISTLIHSKTTYHLTQGMTWSLVERLETDSTYFRPRYLPESFQIEKAAYYTATSKEVKILSGIWYRLNFSNRLGLIIHEKFRQIQLAFDYAMDDELLQKATIMAMVCKPEPARLNLILKPTTQLWGQYQNLRTYNEQLREAHSLMDQFLSECLSSEGLSYQP